MPGKEKRSSCRRIIGSGVVLTEALPSTSRSSGAIDEHLDSHAQISSVHVYCTLSPEKRGSPPFLAMGAKHCLFTIQELLRDGKLPAEKIANRWLIRRQAAEEFVKTYVPKAERPPKRRRKRGTQ